MMDDKTEAELISALRGQRHAEQDASGGRATAAEIANYRRAEQTYRDCLAVAGRLLPHRN